MIRLYRFYNMDQSRYGEPFALCDECRKTQPVPDVCYLQVIADHARQECAKCGKEPK